MIKLIKTIKQERGELTVSVFRTDGQIAYDAVFVPDKKKGEMFRTEIHNVVSPLINHEVIIAVDEYLQIEEDLENSGLSAHEFFSTPKEEGIKVWVSWDSEQNERPPFIKGIHSSPYLSRTRPILKNLDNELIYWDLGRDCTAITEIDSDFAELLGVKNGECKAFFIREADDGGN